MLALPPLPLTPSSASARPCCRIHLCQTGKGSQGARCGAALQGLPLAAAAAAAVAARSSCGPSLFNCRLLPSRPPGRRDFVLSSYQELKKANPTFPILVRECSGVEAKLIARYGESEQRLGTMYPVLCLYPHALRLSMYESEMLGRSHLVA